MTGIGFLWDDIKHYGKDSRLQVWGKEELVSLYLSLEDMAKSVQMANVDELISAIDAGKELPYHTAEQATERITWTLIRILESLVPPDPKAMAEEPDGADQQGEA